MSQSSLDDTADIQLVETIKAVLSAVSSMSTTANIPTGNTDSKINVSLRKITSKCQIVLVSFSI